MSRFKILFAVICLLFGFSGLAQADNLNGTVDSLQVSPSDQPSLYGMEFAKASKVKHAEEAMADTPASLFDNSGMFVQLYTGYDFSFLEDITNGSNAWVQVAKSEGDATTGGGNNSGILASALWGFRLDKSNSLALDLGSVFTFGNNWSATGSGVSDVQKLSPYLMSVSLDYILDIAKSKGSHTYITLGAGWYHTIVDDTITETNGSATSILGGSYSGDTVGGTLGIGEELDLGGSFGLDFSLKGRYANFSKVSSTTANSLLGTGPSSLSIVTAEGFNVLAPLSNDFIDSSGGVARYATVDYSGIDAKVALNLYF